jgi:hypothetical protein
LLALEGAIQGTKKKQLQLDVKELVINGGETDFMILFLHIVFLLD